MENPFFFHWETHHGLNGNDFDLILESYQKAIELKLPEMIKKNDVEQEILSVSKREKKIKRLLEIKQ